MGLFFEFEAQEPIYGCFVVFQQKNGCPKMNPLYINIVNVNTINYAALKDVSPVQIGFKLCVVLEDDIQMLNVVFS